jgi:hypothetical protein
MTSRAACLSFLHCVPLLARYAADSGLRPELMLIHRGGFPTVASRWVTRLGFAWPFVVAAVAAACCYLVRPQWYHFGGVALSVVALGLLGTPLVGRALFQWLPPSWPEWSRAAVAILLTIPVVGLEAYVALRLFIYATLPLGWIG